MRHTRLLWQLFPPFLLITLVSLLALSWAASFFFHQFVLTQRTHDLSARASLARYIVADALIARDYAAVDAICKSIGRDSATRITVMLPDGRVVGDSLEHPAAMDNHADRPEVRQALAGQPGREIRFSNTLGETLLYVALPLHERARTLGVVRAAISLASVEEALRVTRRSLLLGWLAVAVMAALVSLLISRRISRPLEHLKQGAQRFARGELDSRLPPQSAEEINELAEAMNVMATRLDERIRAITRQHNEQEAVLASMTEGVLAVDEEERVLKLNRAAAQMLGIDPAQSTGKRLHELVRHPELLRFTAMVLASREPLETEVLLQHDGEHVMQVHGAALRDEADRRIGTVVVMSDITRLRRLEGLRRDFVANVSHELKTPITSIKGFVETLLDGAAANPDDTERFLRIIAKHADRLEAIIEDLLSLSRIEQEAEVASIDQEEVAVCDLLLNAMQACELQAAAKEIAIVFDCPVELRARVSPALMEQAVVNLLDNAIKYSEPRRDVALTAGVANGALTISVRDQGCGIAAEHLSRLFERFYRVDKSRSRKLGGTGLGLAIVKHIAQAHGGYVTVESAVGRGSLFTIHLPRTNGKPPALAPGKTTH